MPRLTSWVADGRERGRRKEEEGGTGRKEEGAVAQVADAKTRTRPYRTSPLLPVGYDPSGSGSIRITRSFYQKGINYRNPCSELC